MMRSLTLALALFAAGPVAAGPGGDGNPAGPAWQATYRLRDAHGVREVRLLCDERAVELRVPGEPVRTWHRRADGIEHRVLFEREKRVVVFAPGDLRAAGREPDWALVRGLVPAAQRPDTAAPRVRDGGRVVQYRTTATAGQRVDVRWVPAAGLPALYVRRGSTALRLELVDLRTATLGAFASDDGAREYDAADLGDEAQDSFARKFVTVGF